MVSSRDEVPAIVQLQKWESSLAQLKLTEFCEAFISPAKRQLLLLSYEHEALLLPLKDDSSKYNGSKNGSTESVRRPASLALAGDTYSSDVSFGRSYSKCSFVCDVNSLTWGSCGDTYNQKKDGGLRELLFVSGKHGVIVHAFYQPEKSTDSTETALEGELGQGLWVEWGPSAHCINRPSGSIGTPHEFSQGDKNGDLSSGSTSKRWLQTFLAKVEPIERDGKIWTRFPDKSLLPRSAEVVSFSIFDSNSLMHNFLPHANNKSEAEATLKEVFLDPVDATRESDKSLSGMEIKPEVLSKFLGVRMGCLYECPRVFSSNSHHLVGFALTLVNPITLVRGDASKKGRGETLVVVTRLASCGIQWNCSVRLDKSLYTDQMDEWSDLQFSENLLVCLRTSGLIFFYGATHGEYISHLDIVQICGINSSASFPMQDQFYTGSDLARRSADVQGRKVETSLTKSTSHIQDMPRNRVFKKLTVAPCTSLLAAVDGYGIVYVIHACYYLPEKYYLSEKLLPKQHLVHGILGYWEAGGSEIGHQRLLSTLSRACYSENPSASSRGFVTDKKGSDNFHKINDIEERLLSGFTSSSKTMNQTPSSPKLASDVARIILPIHGYRTDDIFCLSSIGVTQLIRKPYVKSNKNSQVVHSCLNVGPMTNDDSCLNSECEMLNLLSKKETSTREAVGCAFQGCLYLVTQSGLSVVLPSISVPSFFLPVESFGYRESSNCIGIEHCAAAFMGTVYLKQPWPPWKVEILDRVLVYEGPEEADRLCLDNGWDLGISRTRRLQLALHYLKFDDIEQSLEMLVGVDKAEDGILRMLFAVIYLVFQNHGNDNDASAASRLLVLASAFATKMIRTYGFEQHKKHAFMLQNFNGSQLCCLPSVLSYKQNFTKKIFPKLHEMSQFLEVIRNLQRQLIVKYRRPGQGLAQLDGKRAVSPVDGDLFTRGAHISEDPIPLDAASQNEDPFPITSLTSNGAENLILMPIEPLDKTYFDSENSVEVSIVVSHGGIPGRRVSPPENPKDMMARWETNNLDYRNVVNDALLSGRLPLAVLQLHLQHLKDLATCEKPLDIFSKVHDIGRAIAYSLFLKGETALAVATLQRLGEDLETSLRQLMLGSVRRSLRMQIAEEMKRHGYLRRSEWKLLERMSLVERFYPCSNFWRAVHRKQKDHVWTSSSSSSIGGMILHVSHSQFLKKLAIQCGEVDGAILGVWADDQISAVHELDEDDSDFDAGYWAAAAVWSYAWDERTINRILLDQPSINGVNVLWESQLEFYICHNRWEEVCRLLDIVPLSFLSDGSLKVELDHVPPSCSRDLSDNASYICPAEKLVSVCMDIPDIKLLKLSATSMCSMWLRELIEQELAKKFMFLKEYWEGTAEIVMLLARSGFLSASNKVVQAGPVKVLNKLIVHYCVQYGLPHLLDLYIHHNQVVLDDDSFCFLLEAAGDCEWAKWFLLSRVKGREYDASFSNAHFIATRNMVCGGLYTPEVEGFIHTVNDMAKGVGEMAALATLMYAPVPIEDCLTSSSVNKHSTSSAMCTLENLRPTLRHFPTLWRTLVAACFGQNTPCDHTVHRFKNVIGNSALSKYVNWRDTIFFSSGHDASLLQMLPWWFPKAVRRLVQLYVQGPLGWQSRASLSLGESFLDQDVDLLIETNEHMKVNAMSWEASIDKRIKEELYDSSFKESGIGLDHHLHRGRPLAAFNLLLDLRVHNFKSQRTYEAQSGTSEYGQSNVQSDIQILLAPATESEMTLLSFVIPLALRHFEDSTLVSSCAFLLELCGLSASMLWIDVSSLKRISFCCKFGDYSEHGQSASNGSAVAMQCDITGSLAEAVADDYLQHDNMNIFKQKGTRNSVGCERPSDALMLALHHLEKASLPRMSDGKTCGYWLLTGDGDGVELRTQQKAASQHWNLVTLFCQMHNITSSTKYLALLARDNDWVGFLSEAQIGGYPFDTVAQVASTEFSDPRLRVHILTVLKSMQSKRKVGSPLHSDTADKRNASTNLDQNLDIPVELFGILAVCEKQTDPGKVLLMKANELNWSILALVASCFPDVSLLSCLTVWLEITAARETSLTKANNIAFQIAKNVGAAVETTNSVSAGSSTRSCHYNQRNPKRRRLTGPVSADVLADTSSTAASASGGIIYDGGIFSGQQTSKGSAEHSKIRGDSEEGHVSLSEMVGVLCEEHFFLPLLRAFEMFIPSCALLSFIRALQAFSQMRLSEASAHLGCFSVRIKEEPFHLQTNIGREGQIGLSWISSTAGRAADAMLSTCPSPYEKRCLLQLLAGTDFGDGGLAATHYRQLYVKTNLAEPCLHKGNNLHLGNENLDDASLLEALLKNRNWEESRNWARQLEASGGPWKSVCHHVTETQAESMVAEWKEFLWDVPEERIALWRHCQTLFLRYSFPALQAGLFFLKHAEAVEKTLPASELYELLLLSLQWLSGMNSQSPPVYPLHILQEIETRAWLLAVESEARVKSEGNSTITDSKQDSESKSSIIDQTASFILKMDTHINTMRGSSERNDMAWEVNQPHSTSGSTKTKRRVRSTVPSKMNPSLIDAVEKTTGDDSAKLELSFSRWEERVKPEELERAVLSLLEFGQVTAAKQLQNKLSPACLPSEFILVDAALKLASISTPRLPVAFELLDEEIRSVILSYNIQMDQHLVDPMQVLEALANIFVDGSGRGLCKKVLAAVKAANVLGLSFPEAFNKRPIELLQLLSLKAQDSFEEAKLLVQTHSMPAASIAQILAESFLKGLLAAHRGGYMESQKEEGPAPLLWRFSDFLKWAELCPSRPEVGHALMRLVITGQEIPHACEVELLILSHHFYKLSACLDGVDVLVAFATNRVEAYVSEEDFSCLARLITGVGNFRALSFILGILVENGQLDLLLQKHSAAVEANTGSTAEAVRGFRMAVLTALKQFTPNDVDAFAMVYSHFDMRHETASLLESQARNSSSQWFLRQGNDQNEDLLEAMRHFIEAAGVYSSIDAGNKARAACAQASLVSLQIRIPDFRWLNLSETNARRALVEQSRFQEALIVAEAYGLNQPSEWALVLWNQMLNPEVTEQFVAEFVAALPLRPPMLVELAKFYRAEVTARGDQSQLSVWLTGGGLPAEWAKYLGRSFRCLLKRTRDLRLRVQMASMATGFDDVADACLKELDRATENAGPLVLKKGHGGAYIPLM